MSSNNNPMFLDADPSPFEKNLRFATNFVEEQMNKIRSTPYETGNEDPRPSSLVKPFPGFCLKTKEVATETKFFVNICQTDAIPAPKDISEEELCKIVENEEASEFRIPMSIGNITEQSDHSGNLAKCCDVAINPNFYKKIETSVVFRQLFVTIVFEGLHNKYGIVCADEKRVLKNKKVFGTLQMHRIERREIAQQMELGNQSPVKEAPKIEVISSQEEAVAHREPEYRLFRKKQEPTYLIGEFKFPDILRAGELTVDLGEDRILIECSSRNYLLDIFIPCIIRPGSALCNFNKATKILTIKMPILGG